MAALASCKFRKISCPNQQYGCRVSWRSIWRESVDFNVGGVQKIHNKEVSKLIELLLGAASEHQLRREKHALLNILPMDALPNPRNKKIKWYGPT